MIEVIGKTLIWVGGISALSAPAVTITGIWAEDWRVAATGAVMFLGGLIAAGVGMAIDA